MKFYVFYTLQPLIFVLISSQTEKIYFGFYMPIFQIYENYYHHLLVFYFFSSFFNNCSSFDRVSSQLTIFVMFLRSFYTFFFIWILQNRISSRGKCKAISSSKSEQTGGVVKLPVEVRKAKSESGIKQAWKIDTPSTQELG